MGMNRRPPQKRKSDGRSLAGCGYFSLASPRAEIAQFSELCGGRAAARADEAERKCTELEQLYRECAGGEPEERAARSGGLALDREVSGGRGEEAGGEHAGGGGREALRRAITGGECETGGG